MTRRYRYAPVYQAQFRHDTSYYYRTPDDRFVVEIAVEVLRMEPRRGFDIFPVQLVRGAGWGLRALRLPLGAGIVYYSINEPERLVIFYRVAWKP